MARRELFNANHCNDLSERIKRRIEEAVPGSSEIVSGTFVSAPSYVAKSGSALWCSHVPDQRNSAIEPGEECGENAPHVTCNASSALKRVADAQELVTNS